MHTYKIKLEVVEIENGIEKKIQSTTGALDVRNRDEAADVLQILSHTFSGIQTLTERRTLAAK